jgi:hypothetical protein
MSEKTIVYGDVAQEEPSEKPKEQKPEQEKKPEKKESFSIKPFANLGDLLKK